MWFSFTLGSTSPTPGPPQLPLLGFPESHPCGVYVHASCNFFRHSSECRVLCTCAQLPVPPHKPGPRKKTSVWHLPLLGWSAAYCSNFLFSLHFHIDSKPTVETLGPTVKSEETTTPYPIDEDATECGDNCSFEDGKESGGHHIASGVS